ncbi:MAG: F0F1 ATP synthase subunit delta [Buchnera aphidicola (Meitanaphis microgallis)]
MIKFKSIVHPYAKAIYELAVSHCSFDIWKDMLEYMVKVSNHKEVKKVISSTFFCQQLANFFISICEKKLDKYGKNFIKILAKNKRLILLESIYLEFLLLCNVYKNIAHVTIISAYTLRLNQLKCIEKILKQRLSKNINIECIINKDLIDGFIVKFNDTVIDLSTQFQLKNLLYFLQC